MKYEMVYFDLDGTLLDFAKAERESIGAVLEEFGIPLSNDQIQTYVEINKKWWRFFSEGKGFERENRGRKVRGILVLVGTS